MEGINVKKRKTFITTTIISIIIILAIIFLIRKPSGYGYKTVEDLFNGLENAINNTDEEIIIKCYPDFMQGYIPKFSHSSIEKFNDEIGDISFEIIDKSQFNSYNVYSAQEEINKEYNINIDLQDYRIIRYKYHDDFSEVTCEVIKIKGKWYLWFRSYPIEPLSYFY